MIGWGGMSLYRRLFLKNPAVLTEMLVFRLSGMPYKTLAAYYGVDKSSVKNWCENFKITPVIQTTHKLTVVYHKLPPSQRQVNPPTKVFKYQAVFDMNDDVNQGRNYLRYRIADRKNFLKRLYAEYRPTSTIRSHSEGGPLQTER